jgi:hypothetical protein
MNPDAHHWLHLGIAHHLYEVLHVHQFERCGIFLLPAYWLVSFLLWCRGYDSYLDNPFEPPPE